MKVHAWDSYHSGNPTTRCVTGSRSMGTAVSVSGSGTTAEPHVTAQSGLHRPAPEGNPSTTKYLEVLHFPSATASFPSCAVIHPQEGYGKYNSVKGICSIQCISPFYMDQDKQKLPQSSWTFSVPVSMFLILVWFKSWDLFPRNSLACICCVCT